MESLIAALRQMFDSRVSAPVEKILPQAISYTGIIGSHDNLALALTIAKSGNDAILELIHKGKHDQLVARYAVEPTKEGRLVHINANWTINVDHPSNDGDELQAVYNDLTKEMVELLEHESAQAVS